MVFFIGVAVLSASLGLTVWARRHLGRYWSGSITVKAEHQLIQKGPYAFVRHPIYAGVAGGMIGTAVALGEFRGVLAIFLLLAAYLRKIRIEERWLVQRFGASYVQYQEKVKALIPFVI
jgi:protein-S-isoprenylcysteine O-methyltransferase Ste14